MFIPVSFLSTFIIVLVAVLGAHISWVIRVERSLTKLAGDMKYIKENISKCWERDKNVD